MPIIKIWSIIKSVRTPDMEKRKKLDERITPRQISVSVYAICFKRVIYET